MNKHKNMVLKSMWITKAEEESIKEISKGNNLEYSRCYETLGEILQNVILRGDLSE